MSGCLLRNYILTAHGRCFPKRNFSSITNADRTIALQDTFNRFHNYLRMSLTEKCNLRCVYCMPAHGVSLTPNEKLLSLDERKKLISVFSSLGVNKMRFTGGEPTVSNQLSHLIEHCANSKIPSIGITSNGIMLAEQLPRLVTAGLTSVNISLDTLQPEKFGNITRRDSKLINKVLSSIFLAMGKELNVKVNCVIIRGVNDIEIPQFVEFARHYNATVRFIELMPFDGNAWDARQFVGYVEMLDRLRTEQGITLVKDGRNQMDPHDTTKWYRVGGDEERGRVGFITSMSSNFCGSCNRLRVTADGKLKVCLFGSDELDLLRALRDGQSEDELVSGIHSAVLQKKAVLGGHEDVVHIAATSKDNRPMILIGG